MSTDTEALRAKIDAWLNNGGADQVRQAIKEAEEANRKFMEAARLDLKTLDQPMTI